MKTLDEVIEILDGIDQECTCCAFQYNCDETECVEKTALHYLKMLHDVTCGTSQKLRNTSQITCPKCHSEFVILPDANNPLTWDELKQMEGKPVWVEMSVPGYKPWSGWEIIDYVEDKYMTTHRDDYAMDKMGIEWQAYRKERG